MGPASLQIGILRPIANEQYGPARSSSGSSSGDFKSALVEATASRRSERARADDSLQTQRSRSEKPNDDVAERDQSDRAADDAEGTDTTSQIPVAELPIEAPAVQPNTQLENAELFASLTPQTSAQESGETKLTEPVAATAANQTRPASEVTNPAESSVAPAVGRAESPADAPGIRAESANSTQDESAKPDSFPARLLSATKSASESSAVEGDDATQLEGGRTVPRADVTRRSAEGAPSESNVIEDGEGAAIDRKTAAQTASQADAEDATHQTSRRELRDGAQETRSDTRSVGESAFQEKVRRWIDGRREGASEDAADEAPTVASGVKPPKAALKLRTGEDPGVRGSKATESKSSPVRIKLAGGRGDGAAAAVSRLLIEGGTEGRPEAARESGGSANAATVHSVTASSKGGDGAAQTGPVANAGPANVVAELLAARDQDAGAVANAAKALNASGGSGKYQATMRLDPPEMGVLQVQVRMNQHAMTLHVRAESEGVTRLIESRMTELRNALAEHGITVERAEIVTRTPTNTETQQHHDRQQGGHVGQNAHDGARQETPDGWTEGRGWEGTNHGRSSEDSEGGRQGGAEPWLESAEPAWVEERLSPIGDRSVDLVA